MYFLFIPLCSYLTIFPEFWVKARIFKVIDGDTLILLVNGVHKKVRLVLIDAPEKNQGCVQTELASFYQSKMSKEFLVKIIKKDIYGRDLVQIKDLDHKTFWHLELLKKGLVFPYYKNHYDSPQIKEEIILAFFEAKLAQRGIFNCTIENPYFYRKKRKLRLQSSS